MFVLILSDTLYGVNLARADLGLYNANGKDVDTTVPSGSKAVSGDTFNRHTSPRTRSNAPNRDARRLLGAGINTMLMFALFIGIWQTCLIILALRLAEDDFRILFLLLDPLPRFLITFLR